MNIEVEIKVKTDSLEAIKEKVSRLGQLKKSVHQVDEYFVPTHRDFFAHKTFPVEWLRIRTNPDKTVLEYCRSVNPKPDGSHDYAEEYEVEMKEKETLKQVLQYLDFKHSVTIEKDREYWQCGDIEVALDTVKDLGTYVEAEAKGDFRDEKEAWQACAKFLEGLGFQDVEKNQSKHGYAEMLLLGIN